MGLCLRLLNSVACISIFATFLFTHCDARILVHVWKQRGGGLEVQQKSSPISELINKLKITNRVNSNTDPYTINSPFFLPPFDSLSPLPQPDRSPPFFPYPPFTPHSPSNPPPSPLSYGLTTPPPPPAYMGPANPPEHRLSPPPQHQPSPPKHVLPTPTPTPPKYVPGPPMNKPPVLNPPPPPHKGSGSRSGVWCVAKPTVPDTILQAAMDYACGSGADCKSVQPNGVCFQPNTLIAHASYAFNSYWQNTKGSGGTCDFGGTAMLVTIDPSFDKCQFNYS